MKFDQDNELAKTYWIENLYLNYCLMRKWRFLEFIDNHMILVCRCINR